MTDYTITPARYAKGMMAVNCKADGSGWKTRAMRLAEYFSNDRYSHSEHSYIMSPAAAKKFELAYAGGWSASVIDRKLIPPEKKSP